MIEMFEVPQGYEIHHNGSYAAFIFEEEAGDYIATYKNYLPIFIYPLERA